MPRELLVFGTKVFKIKVPDDARITFGPWSPFPDKGASGSYSDKALVGTLRIYKGGTTKTTEDILAVFSGVTGYRDTSLEYSEQAIKLEGDTVWKSDKYGYEKEEKVKRTELWDSPQLVSPTDKEN